MNKQPPLVHSHQDRKGKGKLGSVLKFMLKTLTTFQGHSKTGLPFCCQRYKREQAKAVVSTPADSCVCCGKLTRMVKILYSFSFHMQPATLSLFDVLQRHAQHSQNYLGKTFFSPPGSRGRLVECHNIHTSFALQGSNHPVCTVFPDKDKSRSFHKTNHLRSRDNWESLLTFT